MTTALSYAQSAWHLLQKDLRRESRSGATWPSVLLLGFIVLLILELQSDLPTALKQQVSGGLLWLAIFLAGMLGVERSFAGEDDEGCWDSLRMYPVPPAVVYVSKATFYVILLMGIATILTLLFTVLSAMPLLDRPGAMLLVALLANLGLAAIGTLIGALANNVRRRGNLIGLLLLPLVVPILLGAGEATRLVIADDLGPEFWRWVQLLAAFAAMFFTLGVMVFEFVMED